MGPASQNRSTSWPRLAEAGGRPELDLALAGCAGGRIGRRLWAAVFHMEADVGRARELDELHLIHLLLALAPRRNYLKSTS